jgi:tmRNA-binding protein
MKSREIQKLDLSLAKGKTEKDQRDSPQRLWEKKKNSQT